MTDTATLIVVLLAAVAGVGTGFLLGRWRRKRQARLRWKRGCGGEGDVVD